MFTWQTLTKMSVDIKANFKSWDTNGIGKQSQSYPFVFVFGREEEGYMVKYGQRPRKIPMAQAIFYRISLLDSQYGHYHIANKNSAVAVAT